VAVYFRGERLAKAEGHSIQMAEMAAAKLALDECGYLVKSALDLHASKN